MNREIAGKVLVVDDNESNRMLAQQTLEDEGFTVVLESSGIAGIAAFERESPDCMLLDVRMPDLDGIEVCRRIRALPHGAEVPVLFFTALRDVDTFDRALAAGGDDFLTKPIRPSELIVRVQTALKLRRLRSELSGHWELLKRQRDDLQRLQLQKERLTAFIVHDLKNPVNAMDLHAQLLMRDKTLSPGARESASHIRSEARQLTRMIMNLLDVSKADEGQLQPHARELPTDALVEGVLAELHVAAEARKVRLESQIDTPAIHADQDLLRRTLTNLVENAIRYAPAGTGVKVIVSKADHAVEIRVADRGKGIAPELREKVFEPFVQIEESAAPASRTSRGLGLSFCRLTVLAHGGRIWIEDGGPGTVFCLSLPDAC